MARSLLESLGLFAAPFFLYAIFLVFRARHPLIAFAEEQLPRNASGKILKRTLRETYFGGS